ncbi:hypothetical protein FA15DRAFT_666548 [Coprinopsis marcescibilis]|uniref:Uncharacterized protein n=1 Tax=Coprinopsis marcescibilis TaxID=230819 RepID=A0A5C3L544_COPMA|nr:hypothetical protein FA15DRAFT_666548 [Coprinopsis marcescibilis]
MSRPVTKAQVAKWGMTQVTGAYANSVISMFVSGVLFFMTGYVLQAYIKAPVDVRKGRAPYVVVSVCISASYTLATALELAWLFQLILSGSDGLELWNLWKMEMSSWELRLRDSLGALMFTLGDGLLLYRCYIISSDAWWLVIPPLLTYLGTIGLSIRLAVLEGNSPHFVYVDGVRIGLNVGTNVLITSIIAFKMLKARRQLASALPTRNMQFFDRVIITLVESAVPLAIFGTGYLLTRLVALAEPFDDIMNATKLLLAENVVGLFYFVFVALSPQMIIFRVTTGKSFAKTSDYPEFSRPLEFARSTVAEASMHEHATESFVADQEKGVSQSYGNGQKLRRNESFEGSANMIMT